MSDKISELLLAILIGLVGIMVVVILIMGVTLISLFAWITA